MKKKLHGFYIPKIVCTPNSKHFTGIFHRA